MALFVSKKDEAFRQYALNASPMRILLKVCTPLAIYQSMQTVFKIIDSLIAANISTQAVSAVASISQVTLMISAIGTGLATGGSIKISEAYGKGDYALVRKYVATVYALAMFFSLAVAVLLVPFAPAFLRLFGVPQTLVETGVQYFRVEILSLIISFLGNVYIAVERSRGHSKRIMLLNFLVIGIKLGLSALFVYVFHKGVVMIAVATLVSEAAVVLFAAIQMPLDEGAFRFSGKNVSLHWKTVWPILNIAYPIAGERLFFNAGKVVVNGMCGVYGDGTVGALGISNNIGGLTTSAQNGLGNGTTALISQNRGAGKHRRTVRLYVDLLLLNLIVGLVGLGIVWMALPWFADVFAMSESNYDPVFRQMIIDIHKWEMLGYVALGIHSATNTLLLGYGHSKLAMVLNAARVFVYRIPVLWALQRFTSLGTEAVGITMTLSNTLIGVTSVLAAIPTLRRAMKMKDSEDTPEEVH